MGQIPGIGMMGSGAAPWRKIGYSPTVNTTASAIWSKAGVYTFPAAAGKWEVVSSDNTQDIGTILHSGTDTSGGSTTTLEKAGENFLTTTAAGDCIIVDAAGTTPEWGYITAVDSDTKITFSGGLSSGGSGAGRATYAIVDASAKTHAQAVKIEYLTSAFAQKSEIVILNGTTAVDTVNTDLYRVNSFRVIAAGSSSACLGNLTLRADGAGGDYSYITAGFTRARNCAYTVPTGKTLYINQASIGWATPNDSKVQAGRLYLRYNREPATGFKTGSIFYPIAEWFIANGNINFSLEIPLVIAAETDIMVWGLAATAGAGPATVALSGWQE